MDKSRKKQLKDEEAAMQFEIIRQIQAAYETEDEMNSNVKKPVRPSPKPQSPLNYTSICFMIAFMIGMSGLILEGIAFDKDRTWDQVLLGEKVLPKIPNENIFGGKSLKTNHTQINNALVLLERVSFIDPIFICLTSLYLVIIFAHLVYYCVDSDTRKNFMLLDGIYIVGGFLFFILTTILGTKIVFEEKAYLRAVVQFYKIAHKFDPHALVDVNMHAFSMKDDTIFNATGQSHKAKPHGYHRIQHLATNLRKICLICAKHLSSLDDKEKLRMRGVKDSFKIGNDTFVYTHSNLVQLGFCQDSVIRNNAFTIFITLALICWAIPCVPCIMDSSGGAHITFKGPIDEQRYREASLDTARRPYKLKKPPVEPTPLEFEYGPYSNGLGFGNASLAHPYSPNFLHNDYGLQENPFANDDDGDLFEDSVMGEDGFRNKKGDQKYIHKDSNKNPVLISKIPTKEVKELEDAEDVKSLHSQKKRDFSSSDSSTSASSHAAD